MYEFNIKSLKNAKFITFEGGEGSGKSTQIKLLAKWLENNNIKVIVTREPGGSKSAEELRKILLTGDIDKWDGISELLLLYAGRHDHVERLIKPALASGTWVLCDRFSDSTMAYQGYGHQLGPKIINAVDKIALGNFTPDLSLFLDIPVEIGLKRAIDRRGDEIRYETMDIGFHNKLRAGYMEIAKNNKSRCIVINANKTIEEIENNIKTIIIDKFT